MNCATHQVAFEDNEYCYRCVIDEATPLRTIDKVIRTARELGLEVAVEHVAAGTLYLLSDNGLHLRAVMRLLQRKGSDGQNF